MKKERSISTSYIRFYRALVIVLASSFVLLYGYSFLYDKGWAGILFFLVYVGVLIFYWYPSFAKNMKLIKQISYDDQCLYVHEGAADTQIPLERIRDVEIVSLDGMYRFNLMDKEVFGDYILCKTSIWYPFNFKKVDKELNEVRFLINRRKKQVYNNPDNGLSLTSSVGS